MVSVCEEWGGKTDLADARWIFGVDTTEQGRMNHGTDRQDRKGKTGEKEDAWREAARKQGVTPDRADALQYDAGGQCKHPCQGSIH
jgi:hypothetical protein